MDLDTNQLESTDSTICLFPVSPIPNCDENDVDVNIELYDLNLDFHFNEAYLANGETQIQSLENLDVQAIQEGFGLDELSSSTPNEEYTILSLDEVSSSTDPTPSRLYTQQSRASVSHTIPEKGTSVTSKLKSVLKARQNGRKGICDTSGHNYAARGKHTHTNTDYTDATVSTSTDERSLITSTLKFPPCYVCGGTASGLHYGVNTCEPCKGFFTRYLRKKEEYKCAKYDKCQITNRLRGNCSACRLKKCLALGMSRKNSRLGRYSLARRMETILQVKKLEGQDISKADMDSLRKESVSNSDGNKSINIVNVDETKVLTLNGEIKASIGFTQKLVKMLVVHMENIKPYGEDLVTVDQINSKLNAHYEAFKLKSQIFGNMRTIPKDEYYTLKKDFGIEIDHRMVYLKNSAKEVVDVISRYCTFAKQIPNFNKLSSKDQSNLLKSSRYDFFMILMHESYNHEKQVFLAHNGVAFHREEVADKFFSRTLVLNVCDVYHRLQTLKLSKEEKALLIAISLVFTDRCILKNPTLVEKIQFSLAQLLRTQLQKSCKTSASRRFTKIIDCLTVMRDSSELYLREYKQLCKDERVIEEVPMMTEMLFEDI